MQLLRGFMGLICRRIMDMYVYFNRNNGYMLLWWKLLLYICVVLIMLSRPIFVILVYLFWYFTSVCTLPYRLGNECIVHTPSFYVFFFSDVFYIRLITFVVKAFDAVAISTKIHTLLISHYFDWSKTSNNYIFLACLFMWQLFD